MSPRGTTRIGKPTPLPLGTYTPRPQSTESVVDFFGEDGRSRRFDISLLPLPGWHGDLATSWASRVGPSGTLRTRASATSAWGSLTRLIRFLAQTLRPPQHPGDLEVRHIDAYRRFRESSTNERYAKLELRSIALIFDVPPLAELVSAEVRDRMRPHLRYQPIPKSGYSDGELARIVTAARADVATLRDRLLVAPFDSDEEERYLLEVARTTGTIQLQGVSAPRLAGVKRRVAERLFVTRRDLTPLLVLLVATTGWNLEVIKDLPAEHRIIEGLAVEVEVTKRRRGPGHWHQTATWEIGPPGKELSTPGGLYLLLHRMMAPARELMDDPSSFWALWHHRQGRRSGGDGCRNPFAAALDASLRHQYWMRERGVKADPLTDDTSLEAPILRLDFNRLKTSIDVRRTRQMGGHLPSAARTNTTGVLFRNYLAGDQSTIDWARELMAETLVEVEQAAWSAHRRALATHGVTNLEIRIKSDDGDQPPPSDEVDTAWTSCSDHEHHPLTGRRCAASFLDCFHCGNCVVTDDHLPRLLSLLDGLEIRRQQMSEDAWWTRYGSSWAAIRYEVLPKFTEAEVDRAAQTKPNDSFLDLVEPRWDQP